MYDINFLILFLLAVLACIDLMVGVANDAVNFLNSAIGSKVASIRTILVTAALGVLFGVLLSSGMMEIARKGIFDPGMYYMPELMIIFVTVMYQDILLLDLFNTYGLPTSTTVSIVFGLFGAGTAVALIKIIKSGESLLEIGNYIQEDKLLMIISGILLSIVFAFLAGALIQYISRLIFSFNYNKRFKKYGFIWAGFALTSLSFFILLKGAKGASFMTDDLSNSIYNNIMLISVILLAFWIIIFFIFSKIKNFSSLKFIVLAGTFSLALAFSANDLVNFIGAPMAGLNAYEAAQQLPEAERYTTGMSMLSKEVPANQIYLIIAGLIMVLTLFFNKKAFTVAKTTIDLSRQNTGSERFTSNWLARFLVRSFINVNNVFKSMTSEKTQKWLDRRFDPEKFDLNYDDKGDRPSFDLIRAAVILMVAAALISIATSLGLPLSTTYVTFIVAMAAALPDKAWGRESAVYRVSGVVTVVGGWFITALGASLIAGIIATILYFGQIYAIIGLSLLTAFAIYHTTVLHKKKEAKEIEDRIVEEFDKMDDTSYVSKAFEETGLLINNINSTFTDSVHALINYDLERSKKACNKSKEIFLRSNKVNSDLLRVLQYDRGGEFNYATNFSNAFLNTKNVVDLNHNICNQIYNYINNSHDPLTEIQAKEIYEIDALFEIFLDRVFQIMKNKEFDKIEKMIENQKKFSEKLALYNKNHIHRINNSTAKLKRSILYLNTLTEIESITVACVHLVKAYQELHNVEDLKIAKI